MLLRQRKEVNGVGQSVTMTEALYVPFSHMGIRADEPQQVRTLCTGKLQFANALE